MKATLFHRSVQMLDENLMESNGSCPFCESTERKPIALVQKSPEVDLLYCSNCHGASVSRMPKLKALEEYYSHYYDDKDEKITLDIPDRMAHHIQMYAVPSMGSLVDREISILDYGGGDGSISIGLALKLLKKGAKNITIFLVDYDRTTMVAADQRILISRPECLEEIPENSMDFVIASAVIEHVPEPRGVLINLFSALKKGGVFYARTPYVTPLSKLVGLFGVTFDFTYPAHVHDLGAKFWNNLTKILPLSGKYKVIRSTPSIVETSFGQHFIRTLAAHVLKAPGYLFNESYGFVGGWEIFIKRTH